MDPTQVLSERFWVCRIASISYWIYTLKDHEDADSARAHEPAQRTPERAERAERAPESLRRAEVTIRKEILGRNLQHHMCVSVSHTGRDLWVYYLNVTEKKPDVDMNLGIDSIAHVSAHGVFLPPFLAVMATDAESRYGPLLRSIELNLLDSLLKNGDPAQYEAFGAAAALSTGDGSLIRFSPSLYQQGGLILRITMQRTLLVAPPIESLQFSSPMVWLLPQGRPCRLDIRNEDGSSRRVEPPCQKRARHLFALLSAQFVMNTTCKDIEDSSWMRLSSLSDGIEFLWPAALVRATPLTTASSISNHTIAHTWGVAYELPDSNSIDSGRIDAMQAHLSVHTTYPHRLPLSALARESPYTLLTDSMSAVHQKLSEKRADSNPLETWAAENFLNQAVVPPPPSPRVAASPLPAGLQSEELPPASQSPSQAIQPQHSQPLPHSQSQLQFQPLQHSQSQLQFQPLQSQLQPQNAYQTPSSHIYPTPSHQTPNTPYFATPGTPAVDWMDAEDNDDEAVDEADFNFFDLPVPGSVPDTTAEKPVEPESEPEASELPKIETVVDEKQHLFDEEGTSSPSKFSALNLDSSFDSKYRLGGRFFTPAPKDAEPEVDFDMDSASDIDDKSSDSESVASMDYGESLWDEVPEREASPEPVDGPELEAAWLRSMEMNARHNELPVDNSKFLTFRSLIPQLVWDGGLLRETYDAPLFDGETCVPPQYLIQRLRIPCTPLHIAFDADYLDRLARGVDESRVAAKARPKMQLLSPPFVQVRYGEQRIKARITILNFWRILNLAPPVLDGEKPPETKSVTVIMVTLDSPVIAEAARCFLDEFQPVYEHCRFGQVELPTFGDVDRGLLLISGDFTRISGDTVGDLYESSVAMLKTQMRAAYQDVAPPDKLLLMVCYPPSSLRGGTMSASVPFQIAQGMEAIHREYPSSEWLLCSLDLLVNRWNHAQVISAQSMQKLSMLAYSRFRTSPHYFQLVGLAPQSSGLKLSAKAAPPVLMEDEDFLHVAYLLVENRWCLASWTDQWARRVRVDAFRIKDAASERGLQTVFLEIWRQTQEMAKDIRKRSGWQFVISRCGMMNKTEMTIWKRIIPDNVPLMLVDLPQPRGIQTADAATYVAQAAPDAKAAPQYAFTKEDSKDDVKDGAPEAKDAPDAKVAKDTKDTKFPTDGVILSEASEIYGISIEPPQPGVCRFTPPQARGYLVIPALEGHRTLEARMLYLQNVSVTAKVAMSRIVGQFRRLASYAHFSGVSTYSTLIPWHILGLTKLENAAQKLNML